MTLHKYPAGSRGPPAADQLAAQMGYVRSKSYVWHPADSTEHHGTS